jgi:hypothetical protein
MIFQIELLENTIHKLLNTKELPGIIVPIVIHFTEPKSYKVIPIISLKSNGIEDILNACMRYVTMNPVDMKKERRLIIYTTYVMDEHNQKSNCVVMYPCEQKETKDNKMYQYYRLYDKNGKYYMIGTLFKAYITIENNTTQSSIST